MSTTRYKVPYHDFLGQDMSQTDGFLYVYEHHTSGVNRIFDETGKLLFSWGGDCEGNKSVLIAQIVLGQDEEIEKAEFGDGELEQLDRWFWQPRS